MRDLLLTAIIFGSLPFIVKRPFWGLLMWVWLSLMNPHRLTFGFAYSMPFAQITAIAMLVGLLLKASTLYRFPLNGVTIFSMLFMAWLGVSALLPFETRGGSNEFYYWSRAIKIQIMVLVTFVVVGNRDELTKLMWVLALSIGYYGIKGGVFVVATGGSYKVWGPADTFIGDNNSMALALVMIVPLFRYLQLYAEGLWVRRGCLAAAILCTVSAVGSYSRGALLAMLAMGTFLWLKGRNRLVMLVFVLIAAPLGLSFMPDEWMERMNTITTYDEDASAQGRLTAWRMAWHLAIDRFPIGGGFGAWSDEAFAKYAPDAIDSLVAHSIYFQVLGEHGFIGLFLFICIFIIAFRTGSSVIRLAGKSPELAWAADMAKMCQVSLIAFAVGGAFLSLSYFDLPYYVAAMLVVLKRLLLAAPPGTAASALRGAAPRPVLGHGS